MFYICLMNIILCKNFLFNVIYVLFSPFTRLCFYFQLSYRRTKILQVKFSICLVQNLGWLQVELLPVFVQIRGGNIYAMHLTMSTDYAIRIIVYLSDRKYLASSRELSKIWIFHKVMYLKFSGLYKKQDWSNRVPE